MTVLTVRTFPAEPPPGRPYVQDDLPRILLREYDNRPLADLDADALVILEWDIAADGCELQAFREHAERAPDLPLAAPYKIGEEPGRRWVNAIGDGDSFRQVREGEPWCYWFGLGLTYLPMPLIRAFFDARIPGTDGRFTDSNFCRWWQKGSAIDWSVRPVHLHGGWD